MAKKEDGGAAFPGENDESKMYNWVNRGMTLRDYFAAKAPDPDASDLRDVLGWERDMRIGSAEEIDNDDEGWRDSFTKRWHSLPIADRTNAITKWNYIYADAMLVARES